METPLDVKKGITRQDIAEYAGDISMFMRVFCIEDADLGGLMLGLPGRKIQCSMEVVPVVGPACVISYIADGIGAPLKLEIGLSQREVTIVLNCNEQIPGYTPYGNPNRAGHIHQSRRLEGRGVIGAREGLEYLASLV